MNFSRNAALWIFIVLLLFLLFNLFQGPGQRTRANESYARMETACNESRNRSSIGVCSRPNLQCR